MTTIGSIQTTDDLKNRESLIAELQFMRLSVARLSEEIVRLRSADETLLLAAKAVVARWDTPLWKNEPHTGEYIYALRRAIEKLSAAEVKNT